MTDIIQRLRNPSGDIFPMCREAADEIERLRAAVKTQGAEIDRLCELLRRALEPKFTRVTRGPLPIEED